MKGKNNCGVNIASSDFLNCCMRSNGKYEQKRVFGDTFLMYQFRKENNVRSECFIFYPLECFIEGRGSQSIMLNCLTLLLELTRLQPRS